jgi:hypothetical protein
VKDAVHGRDHESDDGEMLAEQERILAALR